MRKSVQPVPAALLLTAALGACGGSDSPSPAESGVENGGSESAGEGRGVRLLARREVAVAGKPLGLLARDFDGDDFEDVLVLTGAPGALTLLRGGPNGLVRGAEPLKLQDDFPLGPVDLETAGFAVALQGTREVLWFRESDPARPPLRVELPSVPRVLDAGDIDGNGTIELLLATADDTLVIVSADGSLASIALPPELAGRATFLHVLPGVGLAVGAQLAEAVFLLSVDPEAGTAAPIERVELSGIPRAALQADLDGDGKSELVVAGGDRSVWVLASDGSLTELEAPGAVPVDLEAADLDGDGKKELVLIDFYDSGYGVLGAFDAAGAPTLVQKEYAGQDPVDGALGDFDGDGAVDLAIANRNASRVSFVLGTGFATRERACFYQSFRVPVGANPTRVRSGNLDEDPLPEAVVLNAGDRAVVARTNRFGLLEHGGPMVRSQTSARAIAVGDWDLDGMAEVAIAANDPSGGLPMSFLIGDEATPTALASGMELVQDREATFFVGVDGQGSVVLLRPGGEVEVLPVSGKPIAAVQVELDGDPRAELAVLTADAIHILDDLERWREPTAIESPGHRPKDIAAADFDGDGTGDLAVVFSGARDTSPGRVAIYLGDGAGGFRVAGHAETGLAPAAIDAGDVDGDGRAELFCAAQNSHNVNVWTAHDDGRVLRRLSDLGAGLGPLDVHLVDLDGDGRLDLLTANNFSGDLSVAYNLSKR